MASTEPNAFKRALQVYTQHLTAREFACIQASTSLSDLVAQAKQFGDTLSQNRKSSSALRTFGEKALLLAPFENLMEGACNMSPQAGQLIWSSVLFILQMAKNNVKVFDDVLNFFQRMAEEIGYIALQENTFTTSPLVQSVIEALYVAILGFWVEAVKYYRSRLGGFRARFKTFVLSSSIDQKFQSLRDAIAEEKTRLHQVSDAQHNADSASFFKQSNYFHHSARQKELKEWLNASDYEQDLRAADELRYQGTCQWMQRKQSYIDWTTSTSRPFLFIHGIPGAGKTILSSWCISDARSRATPNQLLLYHYFKATDTDKCTPVSALRSFIDQLLNRFRRINSSLLSELESALETLSFERPRHAGYTDFRSIFFLSISAFTHMKSENPCMITIVMDAMDECQSPSMLVSDLLNLAHQHRDEIKVLMTGRKSAWDIVRQTLYTSPILLVNLEITVEDVQQDIKTFNPTLSDHERLRDRLSDEIGKADNHQGMFLWVYFMCEEVKRRRDTQVLRKLLDHLPKGLDAMYGRICEAIVEKDTGVDFSLYLLGEALRSDEYLIPSATFTPQPPSEVAKFMDRYPFFTFAAMSWTDLVLHGLCSKPPTSAALSFFNNTVTSFISGHVVIAWLVYAIHLLSIEVTIDTVSQGWLLIGKHFQINSGHSVNALRYIGMTDINPSQLFETGSRLPTYQVVHEASGTTAEKSQISTLEPTSPAWIHYDPKTDILLSVESSRMCLRGRFMKIGVSMRPGLVPAYLGVPLFPECCAAAISRSGGLVAAMFDTKDPLLKDLYTAKMTLRPVFLVCWRLPSSGISPSVCSQSQPILILFESYDTSWSGLGACTSQTNGPPITGDGANMVSFIDDDMLVTPRGIWDVNKREWLDVPSTIYQPIPELNMVCFSGNGKRVARINVIDDENNEIEFFDTRSGASLCKAGFPNTKRLLPLAFSYSGQKIVVYKYPSPNSDVTEQPWKRIGVWTLFKDKVGHNVSPAPMKRHLYKAWNRRYRFCVVPGPHLKAIDPEVLILSDDGTVTRRSVNSTWSADDERELLAQNPTNSSSIVQIDPKNKDISLKTLSMAPDGVTSASFENWSFQLQRPHMIARANCTLGVTYDAIKSRSPTGNYLFADGRLFHAFGPDSIVKQDGNTPIILPVKKQDIISIAFSAGDERAVVLHNSDGCNVMLTVIDIREDTISSQLTTQVTSAVDLGTLSTWNIQLDLNQVDPSQFLISISVVQGAAEDESLWPKSYTLPVKAKRTGLERILAHPVVLQHGKPYFHSQYVFMFHFLPIRPQGFLCTLFRRIIGTDHSDNGDKRMICVWPDKMQGITGSHLVWPEDDDSEVIVVVEEPGHPVIIKTGIMSGNMMREDAWAEIMPNVSHEDGAESGDNLDSGE
ncbi:hypothetical protein C0995_008225 [Termitomyces sp. Mi166|nr:hypothetical protein C0995_008225 [Termitomyces sp. Mi166\